MSDAFVVLAQLDRLDRIAGTKLGETGFVRAQGHHVGIPVDVIFQIMRDVQRKALAVSIGVFDENVENRLWSNNLFDICDAVGQLKRSEGR
ncbi:hypothetical protein GCM10007362_38620 [Saccharibacillus endophyticus]|uniref:Resolvase/invertase-type recombinase catalytic domain-containing protein n=1 Tax=Saccharibacillus endophyticus TaxID=2060666 RepID=A0ABQ2A4A8_9BACL|nr:hypothetical protein GCM10007362_38620 [Saccharibacillus endophyticus]